MAPASRSAAKAAGATTDRPEGPHRGDQRGNGQRRREPSNEGPWADPRRKVKHLRERSDDRSDSAPRRPSSAGSRRTKETSGEGSTAKRASSQARGSKRSGADTAGGEPASQAPAGRRSRGRSRRARGEEDRARCARTSESRRAREAGPWGRRLPRNEREAWNVSEGSEWNAKPRTAKPSVTRSRTAVWETAQGRQESTTKQRTTKEGKRAPATRIRSRSNVDARHSRRRSMTLKLSKPRSYLVPLPSADIGSSPGAAPRHDICVMDAGVSLPRGWARAPAPPARTAWSGAPVRPAPVRPRRVRSPRPRGWPRARCACPSGAPRRGCRRRRGSQAPPRRGAGRSLWPGRAPWTGARP